MIRTIFWFAIWLCSFGALNIDVLYTDGLRVHFNGWLGRGQSGD